ncbi:MAG: hypothetical protein HC945_03585, partial [Nitrosarchaeum sp.]|nr:hypothetical protein [Nitrosarchaeum sp.]
MSEKLGLEQRQLNNLLDLLHLLGQATNILPRNLWFLHNHKRLHIEALCRLDLIDDCQVLLLHKHIIPGHKIRTRTSDIHIELIAIRNLDNRLLADLLHKLGNQQSGRLELSQLLTQLAHRLLQQPILLSSSFIDTNRRTQHHLDREKPAWSAQFSTQESKCFPYK